MTCLEDEYLDETDGSDNYFFSMPTTELILKKAVIIKKGKISPEIDKSSTM